MKKVVEIAHDILVSKIPKDSVVADMTCGNGFDTCFLAGLDQVKKVIAFDIQKEAIKHTREKLKQQALEQHCILIEDGHEHADQYIKEELDAAIFNFGYLPHGDEWITTKLVTSQCAVSKVLKLLKKHGILILVLYPGHEEGKKESEYFSDWVTHLDSSRFSVMSIRMENKVKSPYLLIVEKIRHGEGREMKDETDKSSII